MLKCEEIPKFDSDFVENMQPDYVYKLKDKALVAYIDNIGIKRVSYATRPDYISSEPLERWCNSIFDCFSAMYASHRTANCDFDFDTVPNITEDKRTIESLIKKWQRMVKKAYPKRTEIGVELELEPENDECDVCYENDSDELCAQIAEIDTDKLVEDVKSDCSVYGETELNLKHMTMKKWELCGVKDLLIKLREVVGLDNRYGTAGMHIHVSGPGVLVAARNIPNQREEIGRFLNLVGFRRQDIEIPNCEKNYDKHGGHCTRYGTKTDTITDQSSYHGTIEFRCFEVTTDYELFMLRIKFATELFKYLAKGEKITDFARKANKKARSMFMQLYKDSRNPHAFGVLDETELKLMEA